VRFHQGTSEILGRVAIMGRQEGQDRQDRSRPARPADPAFAIGPGSRAFVRLRLETPAVLARGDRYILRAYSPPVTIAGGLILDPQPPRTAIRTATALERCERLMFDPAAENLAGAELRAIDVMIDGAGPAGFSLTAMTTRAAVDPSQVEARALELTGSGKAVRAADVLVAPPIYARLRDGILSALAAHHKNQPLSTGVPREELREQLFAHGHPAVFDRALTELSAAGTIFVKDRVALSTHRLELTPEEERARAAIERAYRDGGLTPPDAAATAAAAAAPAPVVDRMLKLLLRQKTLVKVDALLFHDEALKRLKAEVSALKGDAGAGARIDVAAFKERFGVSRKYAIPLLEYLDRERVTRRVGESRVVL
jgi:selenocysteine-specific elongation factor